MQPKNGVALVDEDTMKAPPGIKTSSSRLAACMAVVTQIDEDAKVGHKNVHALTGDEVYFYLWARAAGDRENLTWSSRPGSAGQVVSKAFADE